MIFMSIREGNEQPLSKKSFLDFLERLEFLEYLEYFSLHSIGPLCDHYFTSETWSTTVVMLLQYSNCFMPQINMILMNLVA
jgi:hypothetical protein